MVILSCVLFVKTCQPLFHLLWTSPQEHLSQSKIPVWTVLVKCRFPGTTTPYWKHYRWNHGLFCFFIWEVSYYCVFITCDNFSQNWAIKIVILLCQMFSWVSSWRSMVCFYWAWITYIWEVACEGEVGKPSFILCNMLFSQFLVVLRRNGEQWWCWSSNCPEVQRGPGLQTARVPGRIQRFPGCATRYGRLFCQLQHV